MALKICLKLDEKFVKFENDFTQLGMAMADLQIEYANLRAEITRKDEQFVNEVAKLKEENRILKCRLMNANNGAGEDEQFHHQNKHNRLDIGRIEQHLATGIGQQRIDHIEHQQQSLVRANNENLVHFLQFSANNNNIGIAIKQEDENYNNEISPGQSEEQLEIEQQIIQHRKQQNYYLAHQMDESADGYDHMEEMEEEEEYGGDLPTSSAGYSGMCPLNEPSTSSYNGLLILTNHPRYCCGKIWKHLSDLKRHQASHKPPSIQCPHCIQKFTQKSTLFRHLRKFHP